MTLNHLQVHSFVARLSNDIFLTALQHGGISTDVARRAVSLRQMSLTLTLLTRAEQGLCNARVSVCLSVRLSVPSIINSGKDAVGFDAERPAGRRRSPIPILTRPDVR